MAADRKTIEDILRAIPHRYPFRFVDEILELDDEHVVGAYRFRKDEYFYQGHFPGRPITPGVILIETMAQTGIIAMGLYLMMQQNISADQTGHLIPLFTFVEKVEFEGIVNPGERVVTRGKKIYFRRRNLKAEVNMQTEDGKKICSGVLAGMLRDNL